MSATVGRFAPSPTGLLHLGHAASAIRAHDFARSRGGVFLLRIEDIDEGRSRPEFVDAILVDLQWLGLQWDGPVLHQSQRRALYDDALQRLIDLDVAYPCFCTRKDIAAAVAAPHGPDGVLYPGTCRALDPILRDARMRKDAHAWRLDAAKAASRTGALSFEDNGERISVDPALLGDVVIARKDAGTSYHLACTVDDADQGVTDIVRGTDLLPSTHVHRLLQALLALPAPRYHHHPLIMGEDGERLAKRNGAKSLAELRAQGITPSEIRQRLGLCR
jgi:glutamyl-Q tRNA(Asp) synthetase|tara:strand:+ start:22702 stop:23529 length:828 start_codon:yes stop_codon:yes gene_type:complete